MSWCHVSPPQLSSCLTPVLQISCLHRPASNPPCASRGDQGVVMSWWVVITPQSTNHHSLSSVIPASNPLSVSQSLIAWCWEEASDWSTGHNTGISLVKRWRRWSTTDQRQPQLRNITAIIRWQQQHYTTWLSLSIGHGHLHPLGYIWQVIYNIHMWDWLTLFIDRTICDSQACQRWSLQIPMMAAVAGQLRSALDWQSPPPLPGSSVKISQHVTLNITSSSILFQSILLGVCILYEGY